MYSIVALSLSLNPPLENFFKTDDIKNIYDVISAKRDERNSLRFNAPPYVIIA